MTFKAFSAYLQQIKRNRWMRFDQVSFWPVANLLHVVGVSNQRSRMEPGLGFSKLLQPLRSCVNFCWSVFEMKRNSAPYLYSFQSVSRSNFFQIIFALASMLFSSKPSTYITVKASSAPTLKSRRQEKRKPPLLRLVTSPVREDGSPILRYSIGRTMETLGLLLLSKSSFKFLIVLPL